MIPSMCFAKTVIFWYLTGFNEPEAILVLLKSATGLGSSIMFCQPKDALAEIWHGRRLGCLAAVEQLGLDDAFDNTDIDSALPALLSGVDAVYSLYQQTHLQTRLNHMITALKQVPKKGDLAPSQLIDCQAWLDQMRLLKSPAELAIMQAVADISADAHRVTMQYCQSGMNEYQLEAQIQYQFAVHGARSPAYTTIVGGGANACILHYTDNNQTLRDGDLVLIDAGGELQGYAADITRTFPVNGKFSAQQAALYDIVLQAQLVAIDCLQPNTFITDANTACVEVLTQGLLELGILTGTLADNLEQLTYRQYFMHGLGHYLGLDVHDVGAYAVKGQSCALQPGTVMTVEPGLYIAPGSPCPAEFHGIGIRIEDNIVITNEGNHVLTHAVPKDRLEIEALMSTVRELSRQ